MDQLVHAILAIDKVHTSPQRAWTSGPGVGRKHVIVGQMGINPMNQIY